MVLLKHLKYYFYCTQVDLLHLAAGALTPSFLLRILTYPCFTMSLKLEAMVVEGSRAVGGLPIREKEERGAVFSFSVAKAFTGRLVRSNRRERSPLRCQPQRRGWRCGAAARSIRERRDIPFGF